MKALKLLILMFVFFSCTKEESLDVPLNYDGYYMGNLSYNIDDKIVTFDSTLRIIKDNQIVWFNNSKIRSDFYPKNNKYNINAKISGNGVCYDENKVIYSTYKYIMTFVGTGLIKDDSLIESGVVVDSTIHYNLDQQVTQMLIQRGKFTGKFIKN